MVLSLAVGKRSVGTLLIGRRITIGVRRSNANAADFSRHDRAALQFISILRQYLLANCALLAGAEVDKTHDAGMRQASANGKFAKVLVESDQDALFSMRPRQDIFITGIMI